MVLEKVQMGIYGGLKMNKVRVIDLLNKIANGEEVPEKIKVGNIIWSFDKKEKTYFMNNTNIQLFYVEKITKRLNDEVEVIEEEPRDIEVCGSLFTRSEYNRLAGIKEDKKIEKIDLSEWAEITYSEDWKMLAYDFNRNSNLFVNKINEIIDYLDKESD